MFRGWQILARGTALCNEIAETYRAYYMDDQWHMHPADFPGQVFPNQYVFQDLRYAKAILRLERNIAGGCYDNASRCAGMKNVIQPYSGKDPFTGSKAIPRYLDVVAEPGSDQLGYDDQGYGGVGDEAGCDSEAVSGGEG